MRGDAHLVFDIALGGLADRDDARRAAQAAAEAVTAQMHAQLRGIVLKEKVGHVVNGHDIRLNHQQRDAIERDMDEVRSEAAQEKREGNVIQRAMIAAGVDGGMKILRQAGQRLHVGGSGDDGVAIAAVDRAQRLDEASDIGSDSEILNAPCVDDDVGRHARYARRLASSRRAGSGR